MERIIPAIIPQSLDHLRDTFLSIVPPAHEVQMGNLFHLPHGPIEGVAQ